MQYELIAFPYVPVGDANPHSEAIETVVNALLWISDLIAYIKGSIDDHTGTGAGWT